MFAKSYRKMFIIASCVAVASFLLFVIGIRAVLNNHISIANYIAYAVFSLTAGILTAMLFYKFRIAAWFFTAGLIVGFADMYRAFFRDLSGWNDLVGIISLFTWILVFLAAGIVAQFVFWLVKRLRKDKPKK